MAAVFCASLRRRAMVWRSRVIFTRSSRAASSAGEGARTWMAAAGWATGRRRRGGALDRRHHVALGDAAILAGAGDGRGIHAALGGELAHRRRHRQLVGHHLGGRGRRRRRLDRLGRLRGLLGRGRLGRPARTLAGAGLAAAAAPSWIWPSSAPGRDRLAVLGGDLAKHAGGRRRHLDRDLVGLQFDQRLVDGDRIARLLEPAADGRLGHRFAERRDADFSHDSFHTASLPLRHARPCAGIDVLLPLQREDVDGQDKLGHDDGKYQYRMTVIPAPRRGTS